MRRSIPSFSYIKEGNSLIRTLIMMNKYQGTPCEIQVKVLLATQQKVLINHRKIISPTMNLPFPLKRRC